MRIVYAGCALAALLTACASMTSAPPKAAATINPTKGNTASGAVRFEQRGDKVFVSAKLSGLAPGSHGFHIHEKGDCSADDAMSAGGHFNPTAKPHGNPASGDHHGGDMPMLTADQAGNAAIDAELDTVTVGSGASTDILGKAVVVHKDPDDFKTQPAGNSGARVACGVIGPAQ